LNFPPSRGIAVVVVRNDYIHKEMRVRGRVPSDLRVQQDSLRKMHLLRQKNYS
ncbi:GGDEF domain-containing protein, partial [Sesbania bispinosa]